MKDWIRIDLQLGMGEQRFVCTGNHKTHHRLVQRFPLVIFSVREDFFPILLMMTSKKALMCKTQHTL